MREKLRTLFGGPPDPAAEQPTSRVLDLFMDGEGIPAIAAIMNPGIGGVRLMACQQAVEEEIRAYILQLEHELDAR